MAQVDIIIPLYNKAATVARAVRSVQAQTLTDWHLIVVDDGSTDNSAEIIAGFKDGRIELVRQENRGPGAARNTGIARAASEYVAFLDADDELLPEYLANAVTAVRQKNVALVATMYYQWPEQVDVTGRFAGLGVRPGKYHLTGNEKPRWTSALLGFPNSSNTLAQTDIVRKYDGFYEKNRCLRGEDTTLFFRIGFGEEFMIIGPPALRYHSEDSALGAGGQDYPLQPYLAEPETVLQYCPQEKRKLLRKVLDFRALATARQWARRGLTEQAAALLARFPGAKRYWRTYCRYMIESTISKLKGRPGPD